MKRYFLLLIVLSGFIAVAQETTPEADMPCPLADGVVNIAWIPKALDNPVFELGRIGAETRADELSTTGSCAVELFAVAPLNPSPDEQAELVYELIELGTIDAIGISCIDADSCIEPINSAINAGIPTMTWDSDSPDSDRLTYLGIDNYEAGQMAAELLLHAMGDSGEIAILGGIEGSQNLDDRVQGFLDIIAEYPAIDVVAIVYSDEIPNQGVEAVEAVMAEHPDLDGWFFAGLWAFLTGRGSMPLWEAATLDEQVSNIAFDTLPFELQLMQDSYLQGLVGQKYWGWGSDTVQMLYDHVLFGTEYDDFTNSGMDIVTPLNLDAMLAAWEDNDFTQPLPDPFIDTDTPEDDD